MFIVLIAILFIICLIFIAALACWTSIFIKKQARKSNSNPYDPQKKLTVFLVTNNYSPFSGGVVSAIDSYAHELRSLGHRAIIITLDFCPNLKREQDLIRISCPIRFIYKNNHMAIPWFATGTLLKLAEQYKPDIIHTYHPFLLGVSALKVASKLNIPLVFSYLTLYDQYVHYIPFPQCITKPITRWCVNNFCNKVDALIVPGQSIQKYIQAQGVKQSAIILPQSILPIFISETFPAKTVHHKGRTTLVTVSRFAQEKNLYFLLDMFASLEPQKFHLVLVGFGVLEDALRTYAYETLKLTHQDITFIIKPSKPELRDWYLKADLFVFASHTETQGIVLDEAMACGTPVIALEAPGVSDSIVNDENGFMVHSQEEMKETIETIINNPQLLRKLQHNAWRSAQNYNPKKRAIRLINLYATLLS